MWGACELWHANHRRLLAHHAGAVRWGTRREKALEATGAGRTMRGR
jgi:hypothetical protein